MKNEIRPHKDKRVRKLKLQMQVSLAGFNSAGPNDEQKWVTWAWDEIKQYVLDLANSADTELIGRKLAIDYIPYWIDTYTKPEDPMYEARLSGLAAVCKN